MTGKQFRAALKKLRLSQMDATRLFEVQQSTVYRWAWDKRKVPPAVVLVLTGYLKAGLVFKGGRGGVYPRPRKGRAAA